MKTLLCISLCFTFFITTISCQQKTPLPKNTLILGNEAEPQDLDPHQVTGIAERNILFALFEGLVSYHPETLEPVPGMAESWKISSDGLTYQFKLRPDLKWSNGIPLTIQDIIASFQRVLSPKTRSQNAYMLFSILNAEEFFTGKIKSFDLVGIKKISDQILEFHLKSPSSIFIQVLQYLPALPVLTSSGQPPQSISNGPFHLASWKPFKEVVVTKNPHYWNSQSVKLEKIQFLPFENIDLVEKLFRTGRIHKTHTLPPGKIEFYKKNHPQNLRMDPYLGTYFYRYNVTKPPFDEKNVRKALARAIDPKKIVEKITRAGETPATTFVPPKLRSYSISSSKASYSPNEAKTFLRQAGYSDPSAFPKVTLLYNTSESHKRIAEVIQQMWKQHLGIQVELQNEDWKVFLNSQQTLHYDVSRSSWIADFSDPINFLEIFTSDNKNNRTGWKNKQYDQLIQKSRNQIDPKRRNALLGEAEEILLEELPIIPIYFYTNTYLLSDCVQGWHSNLLNIHPYAHVSLCDKID